MPVGNESGGNAGLSPRESSGLPAGAPASPSQAPLPGLLALVLLLTFVVYARCVTFDFVFDDTFQIAQNPWVQSWHYLSRYFTAHVWAFAFPDWKGNYYRPLFLLWFRCNYALFGTVPGWWHLSNIVLHLLATGLVYALGRRMLRDEWTAAIAGLLFGLTPLHLEAVAWVSGVPEVLMTALLLAAFLFYLDARQPRRRASWAAALAFYGLALLVKETALVLPLVLLAYELAGRAGWRRMLLRVAPFLMVTVAYLGLRVRALGGLSNPEFSRPWTTVLLSWPQALLFYLRQLLWPFRLATFYDVDLIARAASRAFLLPLLALLAIALLLWRVGRKSRMAAFAFLTMFLFLLPTLAGLATFQPHDYVHDRYLYLPSVALALLLASFLTTMRASAGLRAAVVLLLAGAFAMSTVQQSAPWDNDLALFARAVEAAPHNPLARTHLAAELVGAGRVEEGLRHYHQALHLDPDYWLGTFQLAATYYQLGRYGEAEPLFQRAIRLRPTQPLPYYLLGLVCLKAERYAEAEAMLRSAVQLRPSALGYHSALGTALEKQGRTQEAQQEFAVEKANRQAFIARQKEFR